MSTSRCHCLQLHRTRKAESQLLYDLFYEADHQATISIRHTCILSQTGTTKDILLQALT
jgi:hypothetical protein